MTGLITKTKMHMIALFAIIALPLLGSTAYAQTFQKPLKCQGEIPSDFLKYTNELIEEVDQTKESADFDVKASLNIHELLQSGMVLFGDSVSMYIHELANKILKANDIEEEISFYVLRSSIFNAFSSDQGFIFVTEGAIAWSRNEEELAFIMCHELAHYLEKHNYLSYKKGLDISSDKKSKNADTENKLRAYYKYSRDHEFEADRVGLELYLKCGYKKESVIHGLSNLNPEATWHKNYAWSPNYLEDEYFRFPSFYRHLDSMDSDDYKYLFNRKSIKSTSDVETSVDSGQYATHPDWRARIDSIALQLGYDSKKITSISKVAPTQSSSYDAIKKTCYMEVLFSLISNASYLRAHYLVLELRKMYGSSAELDYYATTTLNGIYYKYFHGSKKKTYPSPIGYYQDSDKWNITHMYRFFNVLSDDEWLVILSRENLKHRAQFKDNPTIVAYTDKSIGLMKEEMSKSFKNYTKSPPKIIYDFQDTNGQLTSAVPKKKISDIRKNYLRSAFKSIGGPDSMMLVDVFDEAEFQEDDETNLYSRSLDPYFKPMSESSRIDRDKSFTIIVAKPNVQSFEESKGSFTPTPWLDEQYENQIQHWRSDASKALNLDLVNLYHSDKESMTTELWNNAFVLESWMKEKFLANSSQIIPFYSGYATQLGSTYDNGYYMYTSVIVYDNGTPNSAVAAWLTPIIFPYLAAKHVGKGSSEIVIVNVVADVKSNQIMHIQVETFKNKFTEDFGRAHMYDLIFQTKKALEQND